MEQTVADTRKEKIYSAIYEKGKSLGAGGCGEAFLIASKRSDKKLVLKEIDLNELDEEDIVDALGEASIMKLFDHPNIIKIKDVFKTKAGILNIVMEFAEKGDLNNIILDRKEKLTSFEDETAYFTEEEILDLFAQALVGLEHMHSKNVIHRDIKSHNLLITDEMQVKLADFGLAQVMDESSTISQNLIGTPWYFSPELCKGEPFSFKSDIWALGIVLYRLCSLHAPFDEDCKCTTVELLEMI